MPRKLERALTPRRVQTAGPGMWADGGNLYLSVAPSKSKSGRINRSWVFRYGVPVPGGRTRYRDLGMGSLSTLSLSEARERARLLRQKRLDGIDPIDERRAARAVVPVKLVTFAEEADAWIEAKSPEWKGRYPASQRARLRTYVLPRIGAMAVRDVGVAHVTSVLDAVWKSHPNTAALVRMQLESILDYAKVRGHREGENPARWEGHLRHVLGRTSALRKAKRAATGKAEHHAALPYREVGKFVGELRALPDDVAAWALEFTILTAARSGEVVGARWSEIDLDGAVWVVPATRMKAGREHRVPLVDRAIVIIRRLAAIRMDDRVFPGLSNHGMRGLLQGRLKYPRLTVHGFRSCFRTWGGEATSFPREVIEQALAHTVGSAVEAAYQRGDLFEKRRALMDAWAGYCARPVVATGKVLTMTKAAR
jgi:integrase